MKKEIYWIKGRQKKEILSMTFYKELEEEIEFLSSVNMNNELNILNVLKNYIDEYKLNNQEHVLNNIENQLNNWNNHMKYFYLTEIKAKKSKEYMVNELLNNSSNLYARVKGNNYYNINDDELIAYYDLKLSDSFKKDEIREYQEQLDLKQQEINELLEKSKEMLKEDEDEFEKSQKERKEIFTTKIGNIEDKNNDVINEKVKEIEKLEEKYKEKLMFDEPSKYWEDKSKEYEKEKKKWFKRSMIMLVILLLSVIFISFFLFDMSYKVNELVISFKGFGKEITVGSILIIASIESILIYALKICLKYYDYNLKLMEFYKSKAMLSAFFVTIKGEDGVTDEVVSQIYKELFSMKEIKGDEIPSLDMMGVFKK